MPGYPIYGLVHTCDIVRGVQAADTRGSGIKTIETTVYSSLKMRIAKYFPSKDFLFPEGFDSEKAWTVISAYAPNILEHDLVKVPWGQAMNVAGPLGSGNGWPTTFVISTPAGSKTLTWSVASSKYVDSSGNYQLIYNGTAWVFSDAVADESYTFTGYGKNKTIYKLDWSELIDGYSVTSWTGDSQYYTILWKRHQQDERGNYHHSSMILEFKGLTIDG